MAKLPPLPPLPASSSTRKLSFATLRALWINAGGSVSLASQMAAIALAETGGNPSDPWKVGFYDQQRGGKTKTFASSSAAAAAAVRADAQSGQGFWPTYTSGAYTAFYHAVTPEEKTQQKIVQKQADLSSPLQQITTQSEINADVIKQQAHLSDPWVTVLKNSAGVVTGFGEAYGASPPTDALTIGGQPATRSDYQLAWSNTYATDYTEFTGQTATPAFQAQILESGMSVYTMDQQLSQQPAFTSSPIYKAQAAGIADQAKQVLGKAPPATFVNNAIAQKWSSAEINANLKLLPGYQNGPVFQQALDQAKTVYSSIYGDAPDPQHEAWLSNAVVNGWSTDEITAKLRSDPAYTASPEFASKAYNLLSALGLPTNAPTPIGPLPKPVVPQQGNAAAATTAVPPPAAPPQENVVPGPGAQTTKPAPVATAAPPQERQFAGAPA